MNIQCAHCNQLNGIPPTAGNMQFHCWYCGHILPPPPPPNRETSEAVGLIGGAALGAAIGGPFGAVIGAIIGAVIGRESKGTG